SSSTDFATATEDDITDRLHNDEVSWGSGAFNLIANPADPFDLGWGTYSTATQTVEGDKVFFIRGRDGVFRKLVIESLASGVYTFRIALADGSQEEMVTIVKDDFPGKSLAYYSFTDGVVDLEPDTWDLLFTRYTTPLDNGEGGILEYTVTGILHNDGITVADLSDVADPATEPIPNTDGSYNSRLDEIGYDWKDLDFSTFTWIVPQDRVFFVRRADGTVFRLYFVDFQGSSNGTSTIYLVNEGELTTATAELPAEVQAAQLFPNPARHNTQLFVDTRFNTATEGYLDILSVNGQYIANASRKVSLVPGENYLPIDLEGLAVGQYFVRLQMGGKVITQHLIIQ
ncbi:MAG: T9SS type A sorting domain-containing protein, partial [Bacteroidota bacterium]